MGTRRDHPDIRATVMEATARLRDPGPVAAAPLPATATPPATYGKTLVPASSPSGQPHTPVYDLPPPPASIDEACCALDASIPKHILEPEQIAAAMRPARALFEGTPPPPRRADLVREPAPFPIDTDFFNSESEWDYGTPPPRLGLISTLLAESAAEHATAPASPVTTTPSSDSDVAVTPGLALFEKAKEAARGVTPQPRGPKGKFASAKASISKGKGKAPVKRPLSAVDDTDDSVEIVPSDAAKSDARPLKRARSGGKAQIADSIIHLTEHVIAEDAKYDARAEASFQRQKELVKEMVSPLAAAASGILDAITRLADK
jgi:hypothetical protein